MKSIKAFSERPQLQHGLRPITIAAATLGLLGILALSGCSHSSSNPADKDRPAAPPADAIAKIQNSTALTPMQKQAAINAVTVARTRASGQMTIGQKKGTGM